MAVTLANWNVEWATPRNRDAIRDRIAGWDADILVVMPFEGSSFEQRLTMLQVGAPSFPVDLLLCRPEAAAQRYDWGDPFIREALDHGEMLHG